MLYRRFSLIIFLNFVLFLLSFTVIHAQDTVDIAVLLPDTSTSDRWVSDDNRFLAEAFDEAGVNYRIVNAEGDVQTQFSQAEQAIADGAQVMLMVNLDSDSGASIIALARDAGVTIIDYDRLTVVGDGADYHVSFNNEAVGLIQGEGLIAAVDAAVAAGEIEGVPQIAILNGAPTDNNATLFREGYYNTIRPRFLSGEWQLVAEQSVPDWDNDLAAEIFEQMLADNPGIDAVIAANDGLAQAVINVREAAGLDYIPLTGQDATVSGIQNVLAGYQSMTVYKAIRAEARAAAGLAIAILNGNQAIIDTVINGNTVNNGTNDIPAILLQPISVTADNIMDTVIADGFRTLDEICVDEFEAMCPD